MSGQLWIVDPSMAHAETQGTAEILALWQGPARVFLPALRPGDGPQHSSGYDGVSGVVIMGSAASVHDDLGWLERLSAWVLPILQGLQPIPLMGICFGHQLIARLAGGEVGYLRPDRTKRLGVERSEFRGGRLLPESESLQVVVSHRESVTALPVDFTAVASRPGVPCDAMEHNARPIMSVQFHPEGREQFAGTAGIDPLLITPQVVADSRRIIRHFLRVVKSAE